MQVKEKYFLFTLFSYSFILGHLQHQNNDAADHYTINYTIKTPFYICSAEGVREHFLWAVALITSLLPP